MVRVRRLVAIVVGLCLLMSFPIYAVDVSWDSAPGNHGDSILLPSNIISSKNEYSTIARGDFLSGGSIQISNGQDGTIHIDIDTYAHHDVDRIFHTVFLDQWSEEEQDWNQVNTWNFSQSKEESEDGTINLLLTSFIVTGYETNKYYRVRGLHGVEYNGEAEACATETDGVLITDGPT